MCTAHIPFHCLFVKYNQTILVISGHFCESKSFPSIKLVYLYQIFQCINHIPNKINFKNVRIHILILNHTSSYITIVFPSKLYFKKSISNLGNHNNFYLISLFKSINFKFLKQLLQHSLRKVILSYLPFFNFATLFVFYFAMMESKYEQNQRC